MDVVRNLFRIATLLALLLGPVGDTAPPEREFPHPVAGADRPAVEIVVSDAELDHGLRIRVRTEDSSYQLEISRPEHERE